MDKLNLLSKFTNIINSQRLYKENLLEKLKSHVDKNMIFYKDADMGILSLFANLSSGEYLCFDTESCKDFDNHDKERVWCWSLSNTINDTVIYGYYLDEFMELITSLYKFKEFSFTKMSKTKNINIKIWVHNLGWDLEFMKYWLHNHNYTYYSKLLFDDDTVEDEFIDGNSWSVVENNGQTYLSLIHI